MISSCSFNFNLMKSNEKLQSDVQDALKWEPLISAAEIGVTVKDGIVTLTGTVNSYLKKLEAEDAAKNVAGVKAVVEKIQVDFNGLGSKKDSEIATDIISAFRWNMEIPNDVVKVKVEDGWVTLEGDLNWNFQKISAATSVRFIPGVKGITNHITIRNQTMDNIEKKDIERALVRNWSINDKEVHVNVTGNKVTLSGKVHSLYQKEQAELIAWNAPGVSKVNNELAIEYQYSY